MFLEGLASQGKDIKKGPESCAGVTQIQHNVLQLLRGKEQLLREEPGKVSQEQCNSPAGTQKFGTRPFPDCTESVSTINLFHGLGAETTSLLRFLSFKDL